MAQYRRDLRRWADSAGVALALLTFVNLANYIDRYILAALVPRIQAELALTSTQAGLLGTAFMLVYMATSPVFGWLGDRGSRLRWLALGVALWSLATGLAGLAASFAVLFFARTAVGVGEAAYGSIAPSLLADYYSPSARGRALAVFSLAIPAGSAVGYLLGGVMGAALGWRHAFLLVGLPGLALALAVLTLGEPVRGAHDAADARDSPKLAHAYAELWHNRQYVWTVLGYAAYTFAIGGLAFWTPSYMLRVRGFAEASGMVYFGGITVVTGIVGTMAGGVLGDRLLAITKRGYGILNVVAMLVGSTLTFAALMAPSRTSFLVLLALAELALFANTGPVNAAIVNAVRPAIRTTAIAVSVFTIHFLGDATSPTLMGWIADRSGLQAAMLAVPAFFVLAGALWAATLHPRVVPRSARARS